MVILRYSFSGRQLSVVSFQFRTLDVGRWTGSILLITHHLLLVTVFRPWTLDFGPWALDYQLSTLPRARGALSIYYLSYR